MMESKRALYEEKLAHFTNDVQGNEGIASDTSSSDISEDDLVSYSKVILKGTPHTFDSGDELPDYDQYLPSKSISKPSSIKDCWKEICINEKEMIQLPEENLFENLTSLNGFFSSELWKNKLTKEEQDYLKTFLPKLEGWNGFSEEEALCHNLNALFSNENFNFGNPINHFTQQLLKGNLTKRAAKQNYYIKMKQQRNFLNYVQQHTRTLIKKIYAQKSHVLLEQQAIDGKKKYISSSSSEESDLEGEDINISPSFALYNGKNQYFIEPSTSLFHAIYKALMNSSNTEKMMDTNHENWKTVNEIYSYIEQHHPKALFQQKDIPVHLEKKDYIEAALYFLVNPHGLTDLKYPKNGYIWETPCIAYNSTEKRFLWKNPKYKPNQELLLLEQFFRFLPYHEDTSAISSRTAVKTARRHAKQLIEQQVYQDIVKRPKIQKLLKKTQRNRCYLSKGLVASSHTMAHNIEQFQLQEWERYKAPYKPYIYTDAETGFRSLVGPIIQRKRTLEDSVVIIQEAPREVSLLNIVREAVARLTDRIGTRTDIRNLMRHSQFLRVGIADDILDKVVVESLDTLCMEEDPCVRYDPSRSVWQYLHGDKQPEDFDISRH